MNVVIAHNHYQQPGGEDVVFEAEGRLLAGAGHAVTRYTMHNDAVRGMGRLALAGRTLWNRRARAGLRAVLRAERADVLHVHNTFPLLSPAVYGAARAEGCAVVQTLHNYRTLCPNGLFFREGRPCEQCLGKRFAWPGIVHACYRRDRLATALASGASAFHRGIGTFDRGVDAYVAPTEFARRLFLRGGFPADKVFVKPHFVDPDPGVGPGGESALFVGRLAEGKGVETLLAAWSLPGVRLPLRIVGDGELAPLVREAAARDPRIAWLGPRSRAEVDDLLGRSALLVFPSLAYETFGLTLIEAFARGTPVVVSDGGASAELVDDGRNGRHFRAGDPEDLARQVDRLVSDPSALAGSRRSARLDFEERYTGPANLARLLAIYRRAIDPAQAVPDGRPLDPTPRPSPTGPDAPP